MCHIRDSAGKTLFYKHVEIFNSKPPKTAIEMKQQWDILEQTVAETGTNL